MNKAFRDIVIVGGLVLAVFAGGVAQAADSLTLNSPSLADGGQLAIRNASGNKANPNCVGENVSPALRWANPPAGTRSFAMLMFDTEGRGGLGVSHWVAYGIPATVTGFAEGEVSQPSANYIGGKSAQGLPNYIGHPDRDRPRTWRTGRRNDAPGAARGSGRTQQGGRRSGRALRPPELTKLPLQGIGRRRAQTFIADSFWIR
jgi:hypothetical protein